MDRLISLNAVLSAIGEWIAHREYDYTNATEYLRNRIKAIPSAEPCEDANANQHNSNALNDVGQHTNALEGDAISRQDDRGVSLKSVKHALYDVCLHEDNMALFSKLLDRVNKARDWEEYQAIKQEPCTHPDKCHECEKILTCTYYKQEPCEDAISRQAVLDITWEEPSYTDALNVLTEVRDKIKALPSVKQEPQLEQFAKWVATEIFDEWEYNKDSFAEIACRKLEKLGIVREKDGEWELVEPQESEDKE